MRRGRRVEHKRIRVGDIVFDPDFDRTLDAAWVRHISSVLERSALGEVVVAANDDGTYCSIDGKHRDKAVIEKWGSDTLIDAAVHYTLPQAERAHLFRLLNARRGLKAYDTFKARVTSRDKDALEIVALLDEFGLTCSKVPGTHSVAAVKELQVIHKSLGVSTLREVFTLITGAWGHDRFAWDAAIIGGLARFIERYRGQYDSNSLRHRLATHRGGAEGFLGAAKQRKVADKMTLRGATAKEALLLYNSRRSAKGRLPGWT